jgi:hypothetical protein
VLPAFVPKQQKRVAPRWSPTYGRSHRRERIGYSEPAGSGTEQLVHVLKPRDAYEAKLDEMAGLRARCFRNEAP